MEKWVNKMIDTLRICDRRLKLRLFVMNSAATVIFAYVAQLGLPNDQKDCFDDICLQATSKINDSYLIFIAGDHQWAC